MNRKDLYNSFNEVDDAILERSEAAAKKKTAPRWMKWATLAACFCLIISGGFWIMGSWINAENPNDMIAPGDGPASLAVDGVAYFISPYMSVSDILPDGFAFAGKADVAGYENCPYYTNPAVPEWVYVYQEVCTNGKTDENGTLYRTEPQDKYVRYVDVRLRGKDLVCYNGEYYISMWSASPYGDYPDVTHEYYSEMERIYGIRIKGDAPEGFVSAGVAEFSGHDTIPRGDLACNEGAYEVFVNPSDPRAVLVATQWYTAPIGEKGETKHRGYNVYIRYDCPLT